MKRILAATAATAVAFGLSACNGAAETSSTSGGTATASATLGATGSATGSATSTESATTGSEPSATAGATGGVTSGSATAKVTIGTSKQSDGTVERLSDKGGVVTKGSEVTFVYNNGLRYTFDAGQAVAESGRVDQTTPKGHLEIREDGSASWLAAGTTGVATVNADGAGSMVDKDGLVTVTAEGATACASGKGLNLVNPDGSKAQASADGVIVLDKDGKTTRYDRSGTTEGVAGRFNQCGPGNTVQVDLTADVLFEFDKYELTPAGKSVIASAAKIIKENGAGKTVRITGHTDSMGTPEENVTLGMNRAKAVEAELRSQVPGQTFEVSSKGQTQPVAANKKTDGSDNPQGRARNRRVVITWDK